MKFRFLIPIALVTFLSTVVFLYFFHPKNEISDAELFTQEFTKVDQNNIFRIADANTVSTLLQDGTGVIFFCHPASDWCQTYATMLNKLAISHGIDAVYYYDVVANQEQDNEAYQNLINTLSPHLQYSPIGIKQLYVPDTIFVSSGEIIGNDWTTSVDTRGINSPEAYWTTERIKTWEEKTSIYFDELKL